MSDTKAIVKKLARELGFDLVGVTSAESLQRGEVAQERVRQRLMEGLPWFTAERVWRGSRPQELLPGAKSVIAVGMSYNIPQNDPPSGLRGKVARYAWGDDYHTVMKGHLQEFTRLLAERLGRPIQARIFVDDGPMLDRAVAERAGIGWYGKNTMILTPTHGSWVFLGQVLTDVEMEPDAPLKKSCGNCRICIDACPTGAIIAPYAIDNQKCIAFWTIEHRGAIPREMRPLIGDWVFGCDICQDVCPVNRKAAYAQEPAFYTRNGDFTTLELTGLLSIPQEEYQERFRGSPIKRAKRVGLQRNACVALGNRGYPSAIPALIRALREEEPVVRGHAAWALGRIGGSEAQQALEAALEQEGDPGR